MDKKERLSEIGILIVSIIWGLGFVVTQIAVDYGFGPYSIMFGRFLIASILFGVFFYKKFKHINMLYIKAGFIIGTFFTFAFLFQTLGIMYTLPSKNAFITQLNVIFVPFLYYFMFKKKVDIYVYIGVILSTLGIFLLTFEQGFFNNFNIGDLLTLICAILVAFHVVGSSYYAKKYNLDSVLFTTIQFMIATIYSLIFLLIFKEDVPVGLGFMWPLIFLGVLNTAFGFTVQTFALKYSKPTKVSIIVASEGFFGAVGSILILNELLTWQLVVGGLLIILSIIVVETKLSFLGQNNVVKHILKLYNISYKKNKDEEKELVTNRVIKES